MSKVVRHVTSLVSVPHRARASLQQAPARLLPSAFCFPHPPLPILRYLSVHRSLHYTLLALVKFLLYWARVVGTYLLSLWLRDCPPTLAAHLGSFLHRSESLSGPGTLGLRPKTINHCIQCKHSHSMFCARVPPKVLNLSFFQVSKFKVEMANLSITF